MLNEHVGLGCEFRLDLEIVRIPWMIGPGAASEFPRLAALLKASDSESSQFDNLAKQLA